VTEDKSTIYHRLRRRADLAGAAAAGLVLLGLSLSGAALQVREFASMGGGVLPPGLEEAATVAAMTLIVLALLLVVEFPFAFFQGFLLEHRFGLSTQSAAHWLADHAKGVVLGALLAVLGSSVVYAALRAWPGQWWLVSAAVFAAAMVGLAQLAPVVLLPLFYRFKPLERPALVGRLLALARRARTDVVGVFEWALSDHTKKANAALAGLGRTRRILLSDTMLADYSDDEIEVVLAHELAHHVHRDLWRGMAWQAAALTAGFFVADLVLRAVAGPLDLRGVDDPAGLPVLLATAGAWSFVTLPVANALSRAQERAADRYALAATGNVEAFITAMKRLAQQNMAEEYPSPLVRWLFYSHPPIRERIDAARAFAVTRP
jgi:STE24 endopeptidase